MKKIAPILLVAMIVLSVGSVGNGISIGAAKNVDVTIKEMDFSNPIIIDNGNCVEVKLDEANSFIGQTGDPILPARSIVMKFPIGTKILRVECEHSPIKTMRLHKEIMRFSEPFPIGCPIMNRVNRANKNATPFPNSWYNYRIGCGIDGSERVLFLTVQFHPVRYLPSVGALEFVDHATIKITYEKSSQPMPQSMALYDMVIISPSKFSDELKPLVNHKNDWNVSTKLVTLDEIYNGNYFPVKGRDDQEKIKYFIKDAIEKWDISYILLVGSADEIPVRYAYIPSKPYEDKFPSDLYYADIYDSNGDFCSWDSNNNNLFGEYNYQGRTDEVDLYPDVYIGRLACSSESEVMTVVNKIINYETHTYGQEWFKNIVVCGGDTFPGDREDINEGEYANQRVLDNMPDFNPIKLWVSNGKMSSGNINDAINDGAGFVDFSGHGNPMCWATHPHDDEDKWITYYKWDISSLSNGEKLPIVVIDGCSCSKIDTNSLGWHFVGKSNGGAIASLGTTGIAYGAGGSYETKRWSGWIEVNLFKSYSNEDLPDILGVIWANTLQAYINRFSSGMDDADYKTVEEWVLFGDPSLQIGGYHGIYAHITKPKICYLYIFNKEIMPTLFGNTVIVGKITVAADASALSPISKVEFYVDNNLAYTDYDEPYEWSWDEPIFGRHSLKIVGYTDAGETATDEMNVIIFNINGF